MGSVLGEMAAAGLVETAWDDEQNTMVIWKPARRLAPQSIRFTLRMVTFGPYWACTNFLA